MKRKTGALQVVTLACLGVGLIAYWARSNHQDIQHTINSLAYDIGIACLIIAGVEFGAMQQLARVEDIWEERREERRKQQEYNARMKLRNDLLNDEFREIMRARVVTDRNMTEDEKNELRTLIYEADKIAKSDPWLRRMKWPE